MYVFVCIITVVYVLYYCIGHNYIYLCVRCNYIRVQLCIIVSPKKKKKEKVIMAVNIGD